ncbi:heme/hemin ABC transporter substrate-binding protein [Leadbetterella byssophila]|uniref:heme/hemin ABC transporter substrate-binding protein n=1 Tax=Leadbetterella byssophila TaxID=316068 RepID=UPI00399EF5CA
MKCSIYVFIIFLGSVLSCKSDHKEEESTNRIVSLSGAISETLAALEMSDQVVGVDVTSTFPESLKLTAQDLGHVRNITVEPILALRPTLVLGLRDDLHPDVTKQLQDAGVRVELLDQQYSVEGAKGLVRAVAEIVGSQKAEAVNARIQADLERLQNMDKKLKVLFIYARGAGTLMVAGEKTSFSAMVSLADAQNAVTGFEDFKPLSPEALLQSNPDVILMFHSGLASIGGVEGLMAVPGISQTTAGKNKAIISMDGGLISHFGPRTGEAVLALNKALIPFDKP